MTFLKLRYFPVFKASLLKRNLPLEWHHNYHLLPIVIFSELFSSSFVLTTQVHFKCRKTEKGKKTENFYLLVENPQEW